MFLYQVFLCILVQCYDKDLSHKDQLIEEICNIRHKLDNVSRFHYVNYIQLFQNRLSWSIFDTGSQRNFRYSHIEAVVL